MLRPQDIRTLDVILTASCNLSCSYCYQNAKQDKRMSWEVLQAAADWLLSSVHPEVRMVMLGGEPVREFDSIVRVVSYIESRPQPRPVVTLAMITNGTLLEDRHLQFLRDHRIDVQLSFDGVRAAQRYRGLKTFDQLDLLMLKLRTDYPTFLTDQLTVSLTLTPATVLHLADSIDYFLASGVGQIAIAPANGSDVSDPDALLAELSAQFERIHDASMAHYDRTGDVPLLLFKKDAQDSVHSPAGRSMCGVGRGENPAVDVDGQVYGCVTFAESYQVFENEFLRTRLETMRVGPLGDTEFADRLAAYPKATRAAEMFSHRAKKHSSFAACSTCEFLSTCAICPTSIGQIAGNRDPHRVPDFLCAYNLVSQRFRRKFPLMPDPAQWLSGAPPLSALSREFLSFMSASRDRS